MIATAVVSYKRPELLRQTLESYLETVSVPYELLVVDNGGSVEALDVCLDLGVNVIELDENRFPGYATNTGWDQLAQDGPAYLHRSDNDVEYLDGWCDEVLERFDANPRLGQLGLRTIEEEGSHPNVGGNCVIPARVFEQVRWQDIGWVRHRATEDYWFTKDIEAAGFEWQRVLRPCIVHLGTGSPRTDPYFAETWHVRGHAGY